VVLPLLANEVVLTGWVSEADFLTGFALVQAMPGPLFNFAAYLGAPPGRRRARAGLCAHARRPRRAVLECSVVVGANAGRAAASASSHRDAVWAAGWVAEPAVAACRAAQRSARSRPRARTQARSSP
jgi:hypothetical protein